MSHKFLNKDIAHAARNIHGMHNGQTADEILEHLKRQDFMEFISQSVQFCLNGLNNAREEYHHTSKLTDVEKRIMCRRIDMWRKAYTTALQLSTGEEIYHGFLIEFCNLFSESCAELTSPYDQQLFVAETKSIVKLFKPYLDSSED